MGVVLRSFEMPKSVVLDEETAKDKYGKFIAEPFERGFGATVGNSLRRVLLSSLEGAAVSGIKLEGADHEFSSISGILEDFPEIILNIKSLVLKSHTRDIKTITIDVTKKGTITGADITTDGTIEVINPELHIATLDKNMRFKLEMQVTRGRGFVVAEQNKREDQPIGLVPIDSVYSPVKRVAYRVEDTRVGQITDYDRLVLEVWTNGAVSPKDAILYASNILQQQIGVFVNLGQLPDEEVEQAVEPVADANDDEDFYRRLNQSVAELELSVRSANCLSEAHIKTIGEIVCRTQAEMLKYRNFGKKSLNEIGEILETMGLSFGMKVDISRLVGMQQQQQESV
ncbi:MAG: DNA-directed RNA polymerase subunit alpha [Candidatus Omnitrophota bacterium]|jgi:DNA-directed RNA polymerase subunit alpha